MRRLWAELAVIGVVLIWGGNFSVSKGAFAYMPPVSFGFVRFLLASLILLALSAATERKARPLGWREWLLLAAAGLLGVGLYQPLWLTSLSLTTATDSAIIVSTSPLFVLLFAWLGRTERPSGWSAGGFLLSFAGVGVVVWGGAAGTPAADAPNRLLGDVLSVVGAAMWALYVMISAPVMRRVSALRATALAFLLGTVAMAPLAWPAASAADWSAFPSAGWAALLYGAALSSALGFVVWSRGVQILGPVRLMAYQFGVPPVAAAVAALTLGEPLGAAQIVGMLIVLAGILLTRWPTLRLLRHARPVRADAG